MDYYAAGSGEEPLLKLCDALEGKGPVKDVPGLIYKDESGSVKESPTGRELADRKDICAARSLTESFFPSSLLFALYRNHEKKAEIHEYLKSLAGRT